MDSRSPARAFAETFKPYRGKYAVQGSSDMFGEKSWATLGRRLTGALIARAITEQLVVAWFTPYVTNVLGVDIDDHKGQAWNGAAGPSAYLASVHSQVVSRLGCPPSLLVQSPRGMHLYWLLTELMPAEILHTQASERLRGLPVEIRPTPTTALRIPSERRVLDAATFLPVNRPFEDVIEELEAHHPVMLLNMVPVEIRETLLSKKRRLRAIRSNPRLLKAEAEVHFYDGSSNDALQQLAIHYRAAGLSQDEAYYRLKLKIDNSPLYDGELKHNPGRLMKRLKAYYDHRVREPKPRFVQASLFNDPVSEELGRRQPWAKQRTKPVIRFVNRILRWADWHEAILASPAETAIFDYLYPCYRVNRKAGFVPLPKRFLNKANERYHELVPWLEAEGFLEVGVRVAGNRKLVPVTRAPQAPRPQSGEDTDVLNNVVSLLPQKGSYSTDLGICKYYLIHRDGFLGASS